MPKMKSAAVLTIFGAAKMTPAGRRSIARWLDRQKKFLLNNAREFNARYTARYLYEEK